MMPAPPPGARRILAWALGDDPAAPAILGDLHEDFVTRARSRGLRRARVWYWGQALSLAAGRWARRPFAASASDAAMTHRDGLRALLQDTRYALRALRRAPGFAVLTACVIGLGVGATTAVYSVLRPLALAPLPFEDPHELVWIANEAPPEDQGSLSMVTSRSGNLRDFRAQATSFDGLAGFNAFSAQSSWNLLGDGPPEMLDAYQVTHDLLDVLGVEPVLGRSFTEAEGRQDGPGAVLLTHAFWQRRYAGDAGVVGRTITLNDRPYTVVGVLPATFDFAAVFAPGEGVDLLLPFAVGDATDGMGNTMFFVGRLRDGVTPGQAQAELDAVVRGLQEAEPDRWGLGADLEPLQAHLARPLRSVLLLLTAAAGTVLLIVGVNVANLLLARAPGRARELGVRKALGASRRRVARQLLLENLLVALAGSGVGLALAWAVVELVSGSVGLRIPLLDQVRVDGGALAFGVGVAALTGIAVGLVSALQARDGGEAGVLRATTRGSSAGRGARRVRESLVIAEVALACGILVVGGLLLRSFDSVLSVDLGFEARNVAAWTLNPSRAFETDEEVVAYFDAFSRRVGQLPGVEAAGLIDRLPLEGNRSWGFQLPDRPPEDSEGLGLHPHMVDSGYLDAMGVALIEGRGLTPDDGAGSEPVVLLNETGARVVAPEGSAVGRTVRMWDGRDFRVVGVVEDVRHLSPESRAGIQAYFSVAQMMQYNTLELVVRTARDPGGVADAVSAELARLDPSLPAREWRPVQRAVDRALSPRRFTLQVLTAFALAGLLLAGLGIYGVLAQSVAERRREIGIRLALGDTARGVMARVVRRTLVLAGAGVAVGALLGVGGTRMVGSLLYGVEPWDPVTFLGMAGCLLLVAAVAATVPAWRAARTPGTGALQAE